MKESKSFLADSLWRSPYNYHLYKLKNEKGDSYIGISRDVMRRLGQHRHTKKLSGKINVAFSMYVGTYFKANDLELKLQAMTNMDWVLRTPEIFWDWALFEAGTVDLFNMPNSSKLMYAKAVGII